MGLELTFRFLLVGSVVATAAQLSRLLTAKEDHSLKYMGGALMGAFIAHLSFTGLMSVWFDLQPLLLIVLGGPIGFKGADVMGLLFDKVWGRYAKDS